MPSTRTFAPEGGIKGHQVCKLTSWDYDRAGDPTGPYAREIKETAERREYDMWMRMDADESAPYCTRCGTRMVEGEPKTYGCPKCGYEIGV
jgi:hypothetical protein